jgi:hypothetical protein
MADYDIVVTGDERKKWTRRGDDGEITKPDSKNYNDLSNNLTESDIDTYIKFYDY